MAILAEVRLEMIKYILCRGDVAGEGGCEGVEAVHVKNWGDVVCSLSKGTCTLVTKGILQK